MANTVYDIDIKYNILNVSQVTNNFQKIETASNRAEKSVASLGRVLSYIGVYAIARKSVDMLKESIIGFNSELEKSRIQLATEMAGTGMVSSFDTALDRSKALREELLQFSKGAPGGFEDYVQSALALGTAVGNAGGSVRDLAEISKVGVVAGKALGLDVGTLTHQMSEGLTRNLTAQMGDMIRLLGLVHMTKDQFNKLDVASRMNVYEKIFHSEALQKGLTEYGKTFDAQFDSIKDNLRIVLAEVGKPLFAAITEEIKKWNNWFTENKKVVEDTAKTLSHYLVEGFSYVKDVISFLVANKDTIIAAGEAWMAVKAGQAVGNTVSGAASLLNLVGGGASLLGSGGGAALGTAAKFGAYGAMAAGAVFIGIEIGKALTTYLDAHWPHLFGDTDQQRQMTDYLKNIKDFGDEAEAQTEHTKKMLDVYFGLSAGNVNGQKLQAQRAMTLEEIKKNQFGLVDEIKRNAGFRAGGLGSHGKGTFDRSAFVASELAAGRDEYTANRWADIADKFINILNRLGASEEVFGVSPDGDKRRKPNTNINNVINVKMQVASEDPDRFAVQFIEKVNDLVNSKTRSIRGGRNR